MGNECKCLQIEEQTSQIVIGQTDPSKDIK
jgi:hypothetical protein